MTRSQIDRLGARIRAGDVTEADLRLLDEYRRSFAGPYDEVMRVLRADFGLNPTGRAAKSTAAIIAKLRRESVRLSQIQDIAGCRVVVADLPAQDAIVRDLEAAFESVSVVDRRERSSHGYRAVHLLVATRGKLIEIQVRTALQQLWAELSEKLSDSFGIDVKYGGGPAEIRDRLSRLSKAVAVSELIAQQVPPLRKLAVISSVPGELKGEFDRLATEADRLATEAEELAEHAQQTLEDLLRKLS